LQLAVNIEFDSNNRFDGIIIAVFQNLSLLHVYWCDAVRSCGERNVYAIAICTVFPLR